MPLGPTVFQLVSHHLKGRLPWLGEYNSSSVETDRAILQSGQELRINTCMKETPDGIPR